MDGLQGYDTAFSFRLDPKIGQSGLGAKLAAELHQTEIGINILLILPTKPKQELILPNLIT